MRLFVFVFLVCCSFVASAKSVDPRIEVAAKNTVAQYKGLRKVCSEAEGDARANCFAELSKQSEKYQLAKQYLARAKHSEVSDLHLVTGVN